MKNQKIFWGGGTAPSYWRS